MYIKQWRCTLHGTTLDLLVLLVGVCQAGEERLLDACLNLVLVAGRLIGVFISALDSLCQLQLALAQLEDLFLLGRVHRASQRKVKGIVVNPKRRTSIVFLLIKRTIVTCFVCPIRYARSAACLSFCGLNY